MAQPQKFSLNENQITCKKIGLFLNWKHILGVRISNINLKS